MILFIAFVRGNDLFDLNWLRSSLAQSRYANRVASMRSRVGRSQRQNRCP